MRISDAARCLWLAAATLFAATGLAQSPGNPPRFEVASVKPSPPGDKFGSMSGGPLPPGPYNMKSGDLTRIAWTNVRLLRVLQMAYDLPATQISGPDWLASQMYDIQATMPPGTTVADFKRMVQNLLAERFQLAAHRQVKPVDGYWLEVSPGGVKLKASPKNPAPTDAGQPDPAINTPPGTFLDKTGFAAPLPDSAAFPPGTAFAATIRVGDRFRATVLNMTMPEIAKALEPAAGMPIADRTGLTGLYDVHLEYKPATAPPSDAAAADADVPGPDLFDAVQSQLGLKLVRGKVPQETLVIDQVDKVPSIN